MSHLNGTQDLDHEPRQYCSKRVPAPMVSTPGRVWNGVSVGKPPEPTADMQLTADAPISDSRYIVITHDSTPEATAKLLRQTMGDAWWAEFVEIVR